MIEIFYSPYSKNNILSEVDCAGHDKNNPIYNITRFQYWDIRGREKDITAETTRMESKTASIVSSWQKVLDRSTFLNNSVRYWKKTIKSPVPNLPRPQHSNACNVPQDPQRAYSGEEDAFQDKM